MIGEEDDSRILGPLELNPGDIEWILALIGHLLDLDKNPARAGQHPDLFIPSEHKIPIRKGYGESMTMLIGEVVVHDEGIYTLRLASDEERAEDMMVQVRARSAET